MIQNRIKAHRTVQARELLSNELNPRTHPGEQKDVLGEVYREVGFARSLLAFELPDGRLKLIDGHLRKAMDPDMEVTVEVLDVTEEEARKLLLCMDPLAALAGHDDKTLDRLRAVTHTDSDVLANFWGAIGKAEKETEETLNQAHHALDPQEIAEQWQILVECSDENHQTELLARFQAEGLTCKALVT